MTHAARQLLAAALLLAPNVARAHLMPAQSGTLNIRGTAAYGAFALPVSALRGFDDDGNGRLSGTELAKHYAALSAQVGAQVRLSNGADAGTRELLMLNVELDETDPASRQGGTHLLVMVKQAFRVVPTRLTVRITLFGASAREQRLSIRATTEAGRAEQVVLTPRVQAHRFFA
jgi:hypothetical protein